MTENVPDNDWEVRDRAPYSPTILKNISYQFFQDFLTLYSIDTHFDASTTDNF